MTSGHNISGEADEHENITHFRQDGDGIGDILRDWIVALPAPPSSSSDTFYYKWSASLAAADTACGVDFNAIAWKTEAFCNPQE